MTDYLQTFYLLAEDGDILVTEGLNILVLAPSIPCPVTACIETFHLLTEDGHVLLTEAYDFLSTAPCILPPPPPPPPPREGTLDDPEMGFGEEPAPTKCPMCSGTLFFLYGLRCSRCGTRIVRFPGREIE